MTSLYNTWTTRWILDYFAYDQYYSFVCLKKYELRGDLQTFTVGECVELLSPDDIALHCYYQHRQVLLARSSTLFKLKSQQVRSFKLESYLERTISHEAMEIHHEEIKQLIPRNTTDKQVDRSLKATTEALYNLRRKLFHDQALEEGWTTDQLQWTYEIPGYILQKIAIYAIQSMDDVLTWRKVCKWWGLIATQPAVLNTISLPPPKVLHKPWYTASVSTCTLDFFGNYPNFHLCDPLQRVPLLCLAFGFALWVCYRDVDNWKDYWMGSWWIRIPRLHQPEKLKRAIYCWVLQGLITGTPYVEKNSVCDPRHAKLCVHYVDSIGASEKNTDNGHWEVDNLRRALLSPHFKADYPAAIEWTQLRAEKICLKKEALKKLEMAVIYIRSTIQCICNSWLHFSYLFDQMRPLLSYTEWKPLAQCNEVSCGKKSHWALPAVVDMHFHPKKKEVHVVAETQTFYSYIKYAIYANIRQDLQYFNRLKKSLDSLSTKSYDFIFSIFKPAHNLTEQEEATLVPYLEKYLEELQEIRELMEAEKQRIWKKYRGSTKFIKLHRQLHFQYLNDRKQKTLTPKIRTHKYNLHTLEPVNLPEDGEELDKVVVSLMRLIGGVEEDE